MSNWLFSVAAVAILASSSPALAQYRGEAVRVRVAPPRMREEFRPPAPGPGHVWAGGHYYWSGGRHVWNPGRWIPGRPGHRWVDARWVNQGGEWVFAPGYWQPEAVVAQPVYAQPQPVYAPAPQPVYEQPQEVYAEAAPPPPQVEVIPVAPSPNHFWIPGYYGWQGGRHVWYPGRYEVRPAGFRRWEAHRWERVGGRYRFVPGGWRR